jgi:hypothetical protein
MLAGFFTKQTPDAKHHVRERHLMKFGDAISTLSTVTNVMIHGIAKATHAPTKTFLSDLLKESCESLVGKKKFASIKSEYADEVRFVGTVKRVLRDHFDRAENKDWKKADASKDPEEKLFGRIDTICKKIDSTARAAANKILDAHKNNRDLKLQSVVDALHERRIISDKQVGKEKKSFFASLSLPRINLIPKKKSAAQATAVPTEHKSFEVRSIEILERSLQELHSDKSHEVRNAEMRIMGVCDALPWHKQDLILKALEQLDADSKLRTLVAQHKDKLDRNEITLKKLLTWHMAGDGPVKHFAFGPQS